MIFVEVPGVVRGIKKSNIFQRLGSLENCQSIWSSRLASYIYERRTLFYRFLQLSLISCNMLPLLQTFKDHKYFCVLEILMSS